MLIKKEVKQPKVMLICKNCDGTGIVNEEKTCPVCNGTGRK